MGLETVNNIADLNRLNPTSGDPKSQGDDHIRNLKAALLNNLVGFPGAIMVTGVDGGVANAYTVTPSYGTLLGYAVRMTVVFSPTVANTGASTLSVSGFGALPLLSVAGAALTAGDLKVGSIYAASYTGTDMRLLSVTKNYIDQLSFSAALPAQPGGTTPYVLVTRNGVAAFEGSVSVRNVRTANTILGALDSGQFFDVTTGGFTQTFDTPGNLRKGWYVRYRNSSTGNVTIPSSDGLTNWIMYPGEDRDFYCDGVDLTSAINSPYRAVFTTVGANNFIKPPGYREHSGIAWSGGQSGQSAATLTSASGGNGGGAFPFSIPDALLSATTVITVGAGGTLTNGAAGSPGGNTTIGSLITVLGATASGGGRVSLAGLTSVANAFGFEGGQNGSTISTIYGGATTAGTGVGGSSLYGGAPGGSVTSAPSLFAPGVSTFGGSGGAAATNGSNASPGAAPAGGGGAAQNNGNSGPGGRGEVRLWGTV